MKISRLKMWFGIYTYGCPYKIDWEADSFINELLDRQPGVARGDDFIVFKVAGRDGFVGVPNTQLLCLLGTTAYVFPTPDERADRKLIWTGYRPCRQTQYRLACYIDDYAPDEVTPIIFDEVLPKQQVAPKRKVRKKVI